MVVGLIDKAELDVSKLDFDNGTDDVNTESFRWRRCGRLLLTYAVGKISPEAQQLMDVIQRMPSTVELRPPRQSYRRHWCSYSWVCWKSYMVLGRGTKSVIGCWPNHTRSHYNERGCACACVGMVRTIDHDHAGTPGILTWDRLGTCWCLTSMSISLLLIKMDLSFWPAEKKELIRNAKAG